MAWEIPTVHVERVTGGKKGEEKKKENPLYLLPHPEIITVTTFKTHKNLTFLHRVFMKLFKHSLGLLRGFVCFKVNHNDR